MVAIALWRLDAPVSLGLCRHVCFLKHSDLMISYLLDVGVPQPPEILTF